MIDWTPVADRRTRGRDDPELPPLEPASVGSVRLVLEIPALIMVAAVLALVIKTVLAQAFFIPSESMTPQLEVGDRVIVSRTAYRLHEPRRGDVVVFDDPLSPPIAGRGILPVRVVGEALEALGVLRPEGRELIKRVIGLPGENVSARDGIIHIDGRPLSEPYLPDGVATADFGPTLVPEGKLFVMGDNRANSKDSRSFGPIEQDHIVGRAVARVWPPSRMAFL